MPFLQYASGSGQGEGHQWNLLPLGALLLVCTGLSIPLEKEL